MSDDDFTHATLGRVGKRVWRLGLSATYRPGKNAVRAAMDAGVDLFFAYGVDTQVLSVFRELSAAERDRLVIVTGAYNLGFNKRPNLRRVVERRLRQLRTDTIDAFMWLGVLKPQHLSDWTVEELHRLRDEGKVRAVGISCHDRKFIGKLADEGTLDLFMVRYNAAHRGAEQEIFPLLEKHDPAIVSYTATRWRRLLRRPKGWPEQRGVPTAAMCYRFVLSNPHVDVVLTAPSKPNVAVDLTLEGLTRVMVEADHPDLIQKLQVRQGYCPWPTIEPVDLEWTKTGLRATYEPTSTHVELISRSRTLGQLRFTAVAE